MLSSRADSVELVSPLTKQTVVTKKQRTPNTNSASDCIVLGRVSTTGSSAVQSIHGRGPEVGGVSNIQDKGPHRDLFYYFLLVISLKYNNDPVSRCRDAGEKGSRKETIGYGAGGAVSDIGGV